MRYIKYRQISLVTLPGAREIPAHWKVVPLKYLMINLDYLREPISADKRPRNNPQYDYYGASGVIDKIDYYNVDDTVLLIGEDGANLILRNLPLIYKASGRFWVNNHAHILKPKEDDYSYMAHQMETLDYFHLITGAAQPKLSQENLNKVRLLVPPLSEQKGIAAYLDEKCGKVDALVAAKERQVKLLKELRERVIADAVTGKISPTEGAENAENETSRTSRTRMLAHPSGSASPNLPSEAELLRRISREKTKPSGVFWQPMMPAHWVVRKLKYVLSKLRRERYPDAELLVCTNKGKVIKRGESKMGLVSDDISIYQGVKQGDLLIHGMDTWHGAVAVSDDDGMCTPVVHVCDSRDDKRFIAYYLRNMAKGRVFKLISNGVRQNTSDFRSWEKLAAIPIILPPLSEQKEIVEYIERKTAKIDELAQKLEDEIKKLKEFRERLVADVVTGQRKVV